MDNLLLAAGFYHGTLIDITHAMVQIHQGRDKNSISLKKGKDDAIYNFKFAGGNIKLFNGTYSVVKIRNNFALNLTRKQ